MITAALVGALASLVVPRASASPTTEERRQVAEDVATSVCQTMPAIPKLPTKIDPHNLCHKVIVENVDPEGNNSGIRAACEASLPIWARPAVPFCTSVMDKILDPARKQFLDKVVPSVQKLACIASAPATFDCLAKQVHIWLEQAITSLWQNLLTVLTGNTQVIRLLDGWHNHGIVSIYSDVGAVGATLLLGVMLTSLIISAIRFDFRQFGTAILGVITWGLFWSGGVAIAVLLMKASDDVAKWLAGRPDASGKTNLDRAGQHFANWVEYVSGAAPKLRPGFDNPGSLTAILICLFLIIAMVATLVALLMRNIALLMIIMALPLTLAGAAGPRLTREWFIAAVRMFVALLLAKPLIVIAVRVGAVLVSVPSQGEPQASFSDALLGVAIILLAALLPGVIYRFSGGLMNTSAGTAPRASAGVTGQASQSVATSADMTRMIMERNAPRPALTASSTQASSSGTGHAGASTVAGIRGAAGTRGAAGALGGPVGIAAMAATIGAGALESGGRWLAAHAATGGGVFGDVEAPHVPSPPISRIPYGSRIQHDSGDHPSTQKTEATTNQQTMPTNITVIQQPDAPAKQRPTIDPSEPHLIIPGTVVPEVPKSDDQPALPQKPSSLAGTEDDDHE
jgi:hypothetical protein